MKFYQTPITTGRKETICLMKVFFFRSLTRAIHECTRELTRTRTCEYFNSQTGTRTRANLFPRVTRTHESSTHELQVHPPSCKYLRVPAGTHRYLGGIMFSWTLFTSYMYNMKVI